MNIIPDLMYDREKLRSQIKKWKWLFFVVLAMLFVSLAQKNSSKAIKHDYIARINIVGFIGYDTDLIKKLKTLESDSSVKAVIVHIDSPGGTTFGGEELYLALKKLSLIKPVVSVIETMGASGGYMVALASNYIIAANMSITGSIGVIAQNYELVELAKKLGIKFENFKSSPLKAAPNPFEDTTSEVKSAQMELVNDSYEIFLDMLMKNRKMTRAQALKVADGKVYLGKRAKDLKLIDAIGGEEEAIIWLESNKKISSKIPVEEITWYPKETFLDEVKKFLHYGNDALVKVLNQGSYQILAK